MRKKLWGIIPVWALAVAMVLAIVGDSVGCLPVNNKGYPRQHSGADYGDPSHG